MKELKHCMIDIESLDLIPSMRIVSIGAVLFDPRLNKIGDTLYMELDHKAQTERTRDKGTIAWWKKQSPQIKQALRGTTPLLDALEELVFFLPADVKVWGNGATFDISALEHAYRAESLECPWKFWNVRDCRTVKDLYESRRGGWERKAGGDKHNALADAIFQAGNINKMWSSLMK